MCFFKDGVPWMTWQIIKYTHPPYLSKAGYIVLIFMHLGDEKKALKYMILVPYIIFILYLLFIILVEANYIGDGWNTMH